MLQRAGWMVFVLIVGVAAAQGQQRYELKPRFAVGQRWAEQRTNTFEMATTVKVQQQLVEQNRQRSKEVYEFEWEVLAIANGVPTAARVAFGAKCGAEMTANGQTQSMKFPAAGMTVEARRQPDGSVTITPTSANTPEVVAVFEDLFEVDPGAYPKAPVAVGESWTWDKQSVADAFGLAADDEGTVTCTLKSVSMRDGREVADINFHVKFSKGEAQESPGQRIATLTESTFEGLGKMDVGAGRLLEFNLSGPIVVGGIIYGPDESGNLTPQADLDGDGRMTLETRVRLVGAQPAGPGVVPTPTGVVEFAGEYSNPQMMLTLTRAAAGYEGKLRLGAQEFPVRATADGAALKGSFQSEGHWFDFNATLSGTTLSLTTGGKTHALNKKVTPQNPLGGDQPANPLGGGQPANPLGGGGQGNPPQPAPLPREAATGDQQAATSRYYVYRCLDHQGFRDPAGGPLEVFRMLIPEGWRFTGGVTWKVNHKNLYALSRVDLVNPADLTFRVVSPDESVVLQNFPEVHFADLRGSPAYEMGGFPTGSNYAGFVVCPTMDPASYITEFVIPQQRGALQNARIVESRELPSVANRYDREAAIVNGALQGLMGGGVSHRAALVVVDYDLGGRPYREAFVVALGYLQTPGITMWSSRLNLSMRAPREEAERWQPVAATMLNSVKFNMRWIGEYLKLQKQAEGTIIDVDRFCQKVDAEITANRAETNAQIHRDMYPRLAPFCDHVGADGNRYFLETDQQHQMNEQGLIRSGTTLPDQEGWRRMPEYTGR